MTAPLLLTWHGLGLPAQNALSWAVSVGGRPWTSDPPSQPSKEPR